MARICPVTNEKVIYLTCLDCEDRCECEEKGYKSVNRNSEELLETNKDEEENN